MEVMTLNLWGLRDDWPARRSRLIKVMQDEEVVVALMQEAAERAWHPNQAVEIAHMTGYAMAFVPSQRYLPWPPIATGLGILSRFPITNPWLPKFLLPRASSRPVEMNGASPDVSSCRWME